MRLGALDIGSNTVRLLAREFDNGHSGRLVMDLGRTTRLGRRMSPDGRLDPEALRLTVETVREFVSQASQRGVETLRAVGTEAIRRAANGDELLEDVRQQCGLEVRILSGEEEARYSLRGQDDLNTRDVIVLDVGGGSTEWIRGNPATGEVRRAVSMPLGAVGITERFLTAHPIPAADLERASDYVDQQITQRLADPNASGIAVRAVGGTATTAAAMKLRLGRYDPDCVQGLVVTRTIVRNLLEEVAGMTVEQRCELPGLSRGRADILPAGLIILDRFAARCGWREIEISARGIRHGLLREMYAATASTEY